MYNHVPASVSKAAKVGGAALGAIIAATIVFKGAFVYNEAGYQTHIRTIFGAETVAVDVGYHTKWFGRATPWKQAQTVQFEIGDSHQQSYDGASSTIRDFRITFLGNVDASIEASTRFRLPQGDQFLKMAKEYRTPENFVSTALIPAVKETLQATASLMSADDYYSGARSEFSSEFENQLKQGQYVVRRKEVTRKVERQRNEGDALTSGAGEIPGEEGMTRSDFVVEKALSKDGTPLRKTQQFMAFGVEVVEARITDVKPNDRYQDRMIRVQDALAALAVARQNRLKEEEAKLLVIAQGEREVESKRQETLRDQIEQTTKAETAKRLALIDASREKERAAIETQTAELTHQKAQIEAKTTERLADAAAYEKRVVMQANGALEQKLAAWVESQKVWAAAASKAPVPTVAMGGGNGEVGRQSGIHDMMAVMAAQAAKQLALDLSVK